MLVYRRVVLGIRVTTCMNELTGEWRSRVRLRVKVKAQRGAGCVGGGQATPQSLPTNEGCASLVLRSIKLEVVRSPCVMLASCMRANTTPMLVSTFLASARGGGHDCDVCLTLALTPTLTQMMSL